MTDWKSFASWILAEGRKTAAGRAALRRRWRELKLLAEEASASLSDSEIETMLGRSRSALDPDKNDLKAIIAYALGKGVIKDAARLKSALELDEISDPLAFLSGFSGKTFGETWAPQIASFWLNETNDTWEKIGPKGLFDIAWLPKGFAEPAIRIELKASSEHPGFRFQQIRHSKLSGSQSSDYDILLCLGVTAGSLEWWVIPTSKFDEIAENGKTSPNQAVITRHHGKKRPIWNDHHGYVDEGWVTMAPPARSVLAPFSCSSEGLRSMIISAAEAERKEHTK